MAPIAAAFPLNNPPPATVKGNHLSALGHKNAPVPRGVPPTLEPAAREGKFAAPQ